MTEPTSTPPPIESADAKASEAVASARRPWCWWRRFRWATRIVVGVLLLAAIVGLVLTQTGVLGRWLLPQIASSLNLKIDASEAWVGSDGEAVLTDVTVRIPGIPGEPGELLRAKRIVVTIDWMSLASGAAALKALTIHEPMVRVSQDVQTGALNIDAIARPKRRSKGPAQLPVIDIRQGTFELGEHEIGPADAPRRGSEAYRPLKTLMLNGTLSPIATGEYVVNLLETKGSAGVATRGVSEGFAINGVLRTGDGPNVPTQTEAEAASSPQPQQVDVWLRNFTLADWRAPNVPSAIRPFFEGLNLEGQIGRARVRYGPAEGVRAEVELTQVGLTLPIEPTSDGRTPASARPRLREVNGALVFTRNGARAKLAGLLNDLPYVVDLDYRGYDAASPFTCVLTCRDFVVEKNPELLPFVPEAVRKRLKQFSSPTAVVSTHLALSRGEPTVDIDNRAKPAELAFQGTMNLRHGQAAFDEFPYPFRDISGRVRFSNDELVFEDLKGVSDTGATLQARARIAPPDDQAAAEIEVKVTGAPIDAALKHSLGPVRGQLIDQLIDQAAYQRLQAEGLVRRSESEPGSAPVFEPGGTVDVDVVTTTPYGKDQPWTTKVELLFPEFRLVPAAWPYPLTSKGLRVSVLNRQVSLAGGEFRGLGGGLLNVSASYELPSADDDQSIAGSPDAPSAPEIRATIAGLPVDRLLLASLAGQRPSEPDKPAFVVPAAWDFAGLIDGTIAWQQRPSDPASSSPNPAAGLEGVQADLSLRDASVIVPPLVDRDGVALRALIGELSIKDGKVRAQVAGPMEWQPADASPPLSAGDFRASIDTRDAAKIALAVQGLALTAPIERWIAPFQPEIEDTLAQLRTTHRPGGRLNLLVSIPVDSYAPHGGTNSDVTVSLSAINDLHFQYDGLDASMPSTSGALHIIAPSDDARSTLLRFDDFAGDVLLGGDPSAHLRLSGEWSLEKGVRAAGAGAADERSSFEADVTGLRFEDPLLVRLIEEHAPQAVKDAWSAHAPRGRLDATVSMLASGPQVEIRPSVLTIRRRDTDIALESMSGSITIDASGGTIRNLKGTGDAWSAGVEGAWLVEPDRAEFRGRVAIKAEALVASLQAVLPDEAEEVRKSLELQIKGPVSVPELAIEWSSSDSADDQFAVSGLGTFEDASGEAGVDFERATGRVEWSIASGEAAPTFEVRAEVQSALVEKVDVRDARVRVKSADEPGAIEVPTIEATCHQGRVTAHARVSPPIPEQSGSRRYEADVRAAGVRMVPLLRNLDPKTAVQANADELSRGQLDGEMTIAGLTRGRAEESGAVKSEGGSSPESGERRGRGSVRISGGRVVDLPLIFPLIKVSNLQLPSNEALDFAQARFFITDEIVSFEDLSAYSRALAVEGYGTMTGEDRRLNLRFDSRATRRIPLVSWLVESVRNELVTTTVRGTLSDPDVRLQEFPGARRVLGSALGRGPGDRQRRLDQLERYNLSNERLRPVESQIPATAGAVSGDE